MEEIFTIPDLIAAAAALHGDKEAVVFRNIRLSYSEVYEKSCNLANVLLDYAVEPGMKVAVQLPRSPEYVIAYFAVAMVGGVVTPLNPSLTTRETLSVLQYCEVRLLISSHATNSALLNEVTTNCPNLKTILLFGENNSDVFEVNAVERLLVQAADNRPNVAVKPDDTLLLLHTSGTTSDPKRVMLSHRNVLVNARSHIMSLDLKHEDKVLIALPMFFGYCNTAQMITHILLGGTLVLLPGIFTPARFCRYVECEKITTFTAVPTMLLLLLKYQALPSYDLSSLRYICFGGSAMPHERLIQLQARLPAVGFVQTYGQTEASPRITTLLPEDMIRKQGSVGKAIPGVEILIVGDSLTPMPPHSIGEVAVRGKNIMLGYYRRPDLTSETVRDDTLLTGDMGYLDEDGYLFLVGRKKNMIIRAGINIYAEELEEYLLEHPAVVEVAVVPEEHPLQGEVPIVHVATQKGNSVSEEELVRYCKEGLSAHKIPYRLHFWDELPKTYNQKIQRFRLTKT